MTFTAVAEITDRSERIAALAKALEDCERPDARTLERLADAILREELTDRHPDKVTNTEYPFFSAWQLELRHGRETGIKAAEETGADGRNHRKPTKRRRTRYENWRVDRDARGRNEARRAQYRRDSSPGPVTAGATEPFVQARQQAARWRERLCLVY